MTTYTNPPTHCDQCGGEIVDEFSDVPTVFGPWANLCPSCLPQFHRFRGEKFGTGLGQKYRKQSGGSFKKVEG